MQFDPLMSACWGSFPDVLQVDLKETRSIADQPHLESRNWAVSKQKSEVEEMVWLGYTLSLRNLVVLARANAARIDAMACRPRVNTYSEDAIR